MSTTESSFDPQVVPNKDGVLEYEVIVIGAGAGGVKLSSPASGLGMKTAIIEKGFDVFGEHKHGLGGTCLNRGCIPSKMLIHVAEVANEIDKADRYEIKPNGYEVDFEALVRRVEESVDGDSNSILPYYEKKDNLDYYPYKAKFIGEKLLQVGDHVLTADKIFLGVGCRPAVPPIKGLADTPFLTSTEALRLKKKPESMVVIGAGYIAVELGFYFNALGVDVHMMCRSRFLRHVDTEVADEFTRVFTQDVTTHMGFKAHSVDYDEDSQKFTVVFDDSDGENNTLVVDQVLVVTGVTSNADTLDLEKTGVELKQGGFIEVDECLRTTCPGIWAFGDVAGNFLFRHSANYEGEYLYTNVIHQQKPAAELDEYPAINYKGMPWAVFSHPQIAGVGMSEEQAKAAGIDYVSGVNPYKKSAMGDALRSDSGFAKLLIEKETRKILGATIVGEHASILIHQLIPLVRKDGLLDDILDMIHIHPALNEIVRNSARKAKSALIEAGDDVPLWLRNK